jgi:hypothetical protein
VLQLRLRDQLRRRAAPHRAAAFDDVVPVGDAGEVLDVLVDHQYRLSARFKHRQAAPDFLADQRRESFGGFIQDQQPRIGHQRATDRQHLLLAARQLVAHVGAPLGEPRKQRVDFFQRPGIGAAQTVGGCRDQIFADGEVRKNLASLGDETDAQLRYPKRGEAANVTSTDADRA